MISREKAIEFFEEKTILNKREIIDLIGWDGMELYVYNDGVYDTRKIGCFGEDENEVVATIDLSPHCFRELYSEYGYWNENRDEPKSDLSDEDIDCLYDWFIDDLKNSVSEEF